uniref:Uncharacterized protein n=1 Tax=Arundo donax TaxID=35708 RepID=A0A0A8ZWK5_ARUDO
MEINRYPDTKTICVVYAFCFH